ncbi:hypothetical protein DAPPUDRAFT_307799 [Daphnia pulex]|uniref:Uncharacterized protein n=1 Tax=Daphnia pulex TaxID=6669 RepID=E9G189_DAPPU|nr:hypothetical protein DAPPUDRAFT_307799 [Daphnia pulex]|eukprot:EFX86628.1 hypothetical protein DAPPUDRAFT_307799 [Daphnia pulex]
MQLSNELVYFHPSRMEKIRNELAHYSGGCIKGYFHRRFHTRLQGEKIFQNCKEQTMTEARERERNCRL